MIPYQEPKIINKYKPSDLAHISHKPIQPVIPNQPEFATIKEKTYKMVTYDEDLNTKKVNTLPLQNLPETIDLHLN